MHFEKHGLRIGGVEGVVYITRLLRLIEKLFDDNQCHFCSSVFSNFKQLKLHLKDKKHLRFKADYKDADCCFLTNYRDFGQNWRYGAD